MNGSQEWKFKGGRNRGACRIRSVELKCIVSSCFMQGFFSMGKDLVAAMLVQQESSAVAMQKEKHSQKCSHVCIIQMATGALYPCIKCSVQQQVQHLSANLIPMLFISVIRYKNTTQWFAGMLPYRYVHFYKTDFTLIFFLVLLALSTKEKFVCSYAKYTEWLFITLCSGCSPTDQFLVPHLPNLLAASSTYLRKILAYLSIKDDDDKITGFLKMGR